MIRISNKTHFAWLYDNQKKEAEALLKTNPKLKGAKIEIASPAYPVQVEEIIGQVHSFAQSQKDLDKFLQKSLENTR